MSAIITHERPDIQAGDRIEVLGNSGALAGTTLAQLRRGFTLEVTFTRHEAHGRLFVEGTPLTKAGKPRTRYGVEGHRSAEVGPGEYRMLSQERRRRPAPAELVADQSAAIGHQDSGEAYVQAVLDIAARYGHTIAGAAMPPYVLRWMLAAGLLAELDGPAEAGRYVVLESCGCPRPLVEHEGHQEGCTTDA